MEDLKKSESKHQEGLSDFSLIELSFQEKRSKGDGERPPLSGPSHLLTEKSVEFEASITEEEGPL